MQTGGRGIESDVTGNGLSGELFRNQGFIRELFDKSSFLQYVITAFHAASALFTHST
jgi:hypothetical protein